MSTERTEHPIVAALARDPVIPHLNAAIGACEDGPYRERLLDLLHERGVALMIRVTRERGRVLLTVTEAPSRRRPGAPATPSCDPPDD